MVVYAIMLNEIAHEDFNLKRLFVSLDLCKVEMACKSVTAEGKQIRIMKMRFNHHLK